MGKFRQCYLPVTRLAGYYSLTFLFCHVENNEPRSSLNFDQIAFMFQMRKCISVAISIDNMKISLLWNHLFL